MTPLLSLIKVKNVDIVDKNISGFSPQASAGCFHPSIECDSIAPHATSTQQRSNATPFPCLELLPRFLVGGGLCRGGPPITIITT